MAASTAHKTLNATCPSCQQTGVFTFAGEQPMPAIVARKMGLDEDCIHLWHCPNCNSTISQQELHIRR